MKKFLASFLALTLALSLTACSKPAPAAPEVAATPEATAAPAATPAAAKGVLRMATTTSTDDTGLLDYLQPLFLADTGYDLQWTAVGTGDAIKKGADGEVDVILVHAKAKEEAFVKEGSGVERFEVMYNDFIIVGPKDGAIKKSNDINAVFKQIKDESLIFVSRGDDSGTHSKEKGIWKAVGIEDYEKGNKNYISAGAGMGDTLVMTDEKGGYCLTDRGTWLAKKANFPKMDVVCEGDKNLLNQYGVIAVSKEKYPDVNNDGANEFIKWICSEKVQKLIAEFGVDKYGEPLFFPNAVKK
ncbi:MAG: substrate-binding domain-containing protein [Oscillospiraceae bacterium]